MSNNRFSLMFGKFQYFLQLFQWIIQNKSDAATCNIWPNSAPFPKIVLRYFMVKLHQKCPFQDFGRCPKILDYTLYPQYKCFTFSKSLSSQKKNFFFHLENNHYWKLGKFTKFLGQNHRSFRNDLTLDLLQEKSPLLILRFTSIKVLSIKV